MLRTMAWTLRQRRYRSLAGLMAVIALVCVCAGTFEIHRFHEKRHDNSVLKSNAHAVPASLGTDLVPLAGEGSADATAIRFRSVRVSGTFDSSRDEFVTDQTQGGHQGFYVLTPFRTANGTLLVARGFVAATAAGTRPAGVGEAPARPVTITGRLQPASNSDDRLGRLGDGEITAINPAQQSARLGVPVYDAYLNLNPNQPGTADLNAIPRPNLSNPAGGAGELQLLSYILQWYVFALLALAAPFLVSRSEAREARLRFLGYDPEDVDFDLAVGGAAARRELDGVPAGDGATIAVRRGASVAVAGHGDPNWERAARLADRYGRTLGETILPTAGAAARPGAGGRLAAGVEPGPINRTSAEAPHRSPDEYHADYNDYLWQLALRDGDIPTGSPDEPQHPA